MSESDIVCKECQRCGKVFKPKKPSVKFCSRDCTNHYVNSLKDNRIEIRCRQCNTPIRRIPSLIKKINFCSRKCYDMNRAKPINIRCYSCNKIIKRLPRDIHERNFCSNICQANAPKIIKKCATCDKDIMKRVSQTFENKTGNFYCSRDCYFIGMRKLGSTHKDRLKLYHSQYRLRAYKKISHDIKCANCGCDIAGILEINHINGGGKAEIRLKYHNIYRAFLDDIVFGIRDTRDLNLLCKVCNALHYIETVLGIKGFNVTYRII